MSDRHQAQAYPLRLPPDLKARVSASAASSGRSFNAEVAARLEQSFEQDAIAIPAGLREDIRLCAEASGRTYERELLDRLMRSFALETGLPPIVRSAVDDFVARHRCTEEVALTYLVIAGEQEGAANVLFLQVDPTTTVEQLRLALAGIQDLLPEGTRAAVHTRPKSAGLKSAAPKPRSPRSRPLKRAT